jgi:hypothetical protein
MDFRERLNATFNRIFEAVRLVRVGKAYGPERLQECSLRGVRFPSQSGELSRFQSIGALPTLAPSLVG